MVHQKQLCRALHKKWTNNIQLTPYTNYSDDDSHEKRQTDEPRNDEKRLCAQATQQSEWNKMRLAARCTSTYGTLCFHLDFSKR